MAERIDEYDPKYKFFSWIYRIAVNEYRGAQKLQLTIEHWQSV